MSLYDDALAMLKRMEWTDGACQVCGAYMAEQALPQSIVPYQVGHDADCKLMAVIRTMESTPMVCRPLGTAERHLNKEHTC